MLGPLRSALSRQLSNPSGRFGSVVARAMNKGNLEMNRAAIELLEIRSDSRVLDLGFGGGLALADLLSRAVHVTGIDRAADMVEAGRSRHAAEISAGRLALVTGELPSLPLADDSVDRILTVNTIYFWPDLPKALAELRRVLAPDGKLVIAIRDGTVMNQIDTSIFTLRKPEEIARALADSGFADPHVDTPPDGKTHFIVGG